MKMKTTLAIITLTSSAIFVSCTPESTQLKKEVNSAHLFTANYLPPVFQENNRAEKIKAAYKEKMYANENY